MNELKNKSIEELLVLAEHDPEAQYQLSHRCARGLGVPKDGKQAVEWCRRAAEQGHPGAQHKLGLHYEMGRGVPQDLTRAVELYRRAAEQGHPGGQRQLGSCYRRGRGVPKDLTRAVELYRRAAEQGHSGGQYDLGLCYEEGLGVSKDVNQAVEWYRKAAANGYLPAKQMLRDLLGSEEACSDAQRNEAAIEAVQRFSRLPMEKIFHGSSDRALMHGLLGPYMEPQGGHYSSFCRRLNLFFADEPPQTDAGLDMGRQTSNALVLLGLMLLDHAKGRGQDREVFQCTRMTLGQYLDALETLAFAKAERPGWHFQEWREPFQALWHPDLPLTCVLEELLRQYINGWKVLDCLDYALCAMEKYARELEQDVHGPDWAEHEQNLLHDYCWDKPDPAGEGLAAGAVRGQIFLPDRDFSFQALRPLARQAPTPRSRYLLDSFISEANLAPAVEKVNEVVSSLFMLWVGPYLWMPQ